MPPRSILCDRYIPTRFHVDKPHTDQHMQGDERHQRHVVASLFGLDRGDQVVFDSSYRASRLLTSNSTCISFGNPFRNAPDDRLVTPCNAHFRYVDLCDVRVG